MTLQRGRSPLPGGWWDRWSVRVLTVISVVIAVVVIANVGEPAPMSWHAKTWELIHNMAAASVGRR
jgi:hypothetical protein